MGIIIAFFGSSVLAMALVIFIALLLLKAVGKVIKAVILIALVLVVLGICAGAFTLMDIGEYFKNLSAVLIPLR